MPPWSHRLVVGRWVAASAALAVAVYLRAEETDYQPGPGQWRNTHLDETWHDTARDRDVPVRIHHPTGDARPPSHPVIVFSPGLGGSRENYSYLGEYWAAHGYVSVHVTHPGSDAELLKQQSRPLRKLRAMRRALDDAGVQQDRLRDISFVLDELARRNGRDDWALHGRLDLEHSGLAGHSFGAFTTMAIAGHTYAPGSGDSVSHPDARIRAAIAMSTPVPPKVVATATYERVAIPVFHLTGTHDEVSARETRAADRRVPYDRTTAAPAWLLIFEGGDHAVFSGRRAGPSRPKDEAFMEVICQATAAFWDAHLRDDPKARRWFESGGLTGVLGPLGTFESKQTEH